jgi:hypothetical protein
MIPRVAVDIHHRFRNPQSPPLRPLPHQTFLTLHPVTSRRRSPLLRHLQLDENGALEKLVNQTMGVAAITSDVGDHLIHTHVCCSISHKGKREVHSGRGGEKARVLELVMPFGSIQIF